MRGTPNNLYGELKGNVTVSLTPTGRAGIDKISDTLGITRSGFLERIGRLTIAVFEPILAGVTSSVPQFEKEDSEFLG